MKDNRHHRKHAQRKVARDVRRKEFEKERRKKRRDRRNQYISGEFVLKEEVQESVDQWVPQYKNRKPLQGYH